MTIYSSIIGSYFAGRDFRLELRDEFRDNDTFGWLSEYIADPADAVATIMLATRLTEGMRSDGTLKDNSYYRRMRDGLREQWPTLHKKTADKVRGSSLKLGSYFCGDVLEMVDSVPQDAGIVTYPPFYGASRDYENMFKRLEVLFDWDKPEVTPLDQTRFELLLKKITDRPHWMFGSKELWADYMPNLRGIAQTTNRGLPIYLYSSDRPTRVVAPMQETMPVLAPRLLPGVEVGNTLSIAMLDHRQFQALRSQYMNVDIRPGQITQGYGVLVDGILVGAFAYSTAPNPAAFGSNSGIYLLSDFSVAPSDYPKLSKLVLYAALSKESQRLAERLTSRRVRSLETTAFSKNPVSMKYRGLFELVGRKEKKIDPTNHDHANQPYQLQYSAPAGQWTLAEGLALWKKKHGETQRVAATAN